MNTLGPGPVGIIQRPEEPSLVFRLNQRIAAEVIRIATDHVVLSIQGVKVVGRLTSADQAALLAEQRTAQFIVRGMQGDVLNLQLASGETAAPPPTAAPASAAQIVPALLKMANLPADEATVTIARALMARGLPITKEVVEEISRALAGIPSWGEDQARMAAMLKAAGLPVSASTVEMVSKGSLRDWVDTAMQLRSQLVAMEGRNLPPELAQAVREAVKVLNTLVVRWDAPQTSILEGLQRAIQFAGRSLEHVVAQLIQKSSPQQSGTENSLLALGALRRELAQTGQAKLVAEVDRFLDGMRVMHFFNTEPSSAPARGQWLSIDLPVGMAAGEPGSVLTADQRIAKLRVAYRSDSGEREIDARSTRLVVQVELEEDEVLEVDLSVISRTIGARVAASSQSLLNAAESEMPSLRQGLEHLGFTLQTSACQIGDPTPITTMDEPESRIVLNEINIKA